MTDSRSVTFRTIFVSLREISRMVTCRTFVIRTGRIVRPVVRTTIGRAVSDLETVGSGTLNVNIVVCPQDAKLR
jgi:hypothetical protein